jgi:hypothetical protein
MQVFTYQVSHLPDLERTEYHARYGDDPASQLFEMQDNFLHTIYTISRQYPLRCSLIYSFNPNESNQDLKLKILIRLVFENQLDDYISNQIQRIFEASFWKDFYRIEKSISLSDVNLNWVDSISYGIKLEDRINPTIQRDNAPSHYYSIQPFEPSNSVDRVGFLSKLETYGNQAIVEIVFQPTELTVPEKTSLENLLRVLSSQTSYEVTTSDISGKIREKPIDPVAERTLRQFEELREAMQGQLLYDVSIRVLAENHFSASLLLNELWVESSEKPLYREISIGSEHPQFHPSISAFREGSLFSEASWMAYWNNLPENSPLLALKRLHRLFTVEELSACFRVVVPDPVVVFNGIRKETDLKSSEQEKSVLLGWQAGKLQNQARVSLKNLNKHVFICGVPGSGKTTAVLNLLFQLWTEHRIPFLVIEPAKTEYRSMLNCFHDEIALRNERDIESHALNEAYTKVRNISDAVLAMKSDLRVYSLGNERVCPFRFNPFAFYKTTTLDEHISTLEGCFKAAMPLFGPLPALLAEAIEQVYAQCGWQPQDTAEYGISLGRDFPTMQELYESVTAILETKQYSSDVAGDIKTALEVRIGGLLRRSVGSMLNTRTSTPSIADLLEQPVILEMDSLNEEQANLMTMFILATLREYAKVTRRSGSTLKHLVVIEEAHNIVGTDATSGNQEEGASNPKAEATKYIVRMLAEMRALGQGIIIADQLPSAVSSEVIKNTNVKLAHRIVSGDDREILQQSMLLTVSQSEELARSNPGDAYLFMEGTYKPVRIKEPNTKLIYGIEEPPSNEELVACIQNRTFYQETIAAKELLYQQKFLYHRNICQLRFEALINDYVLSIKAGQDILDLDISGESDLARLRIGIDALQDCVEGIEDVLALSQVEVNRLWVHARQHGIFDSLCKDEMIQSSVARLEAYQSSLSEVKQRCEGSIEEFQGLMTKLGAKYFLQQRFDRIKFKFELYQQISSNILKQIRSVAPADLVQKSYQLAGKNRDIFDAEVEIFDKLSMGENLDLATYLNNLIEEMVNQISEIEEEIHISYKAAYPVPNS